MNAAALLRWYVPRRRAYPWRGAGAWGVLVSEVMLQQTQAERVRSHYERFLAAFPTPASLAAEPVGHAIRSWAGLGYNRRAVNLHRAASAIVARHGGRVPRDPKELRTLPGVGPYTAAAVACFAFGAPVPVVDTNIRRVIARHRLGVEPREAGDRDVAAAAAEALPATEAPAWSQALMDLAREVCRSRPRCEACPIAAGCAYRLSGRAPARAPNGRGQPAFEGSVRQARGRAVALLRARGSASLSAVAEVSRMDLSSASRLVRALEADGLCVGSAAALAGRARGRVRLP